MEETLWFEIPSSPINITDKEEYCNIYDLHEYYDDLSDRILCLTELLDVTSLLTRKSAKGIEVLLTQTQYNTVMASNIFSYDYEDDHWDNDIDDDDEDYLYDDDYYDDDDDDDEWWDDDDDDWDDCDDPDCICHEEDDI